MIPDGESKRLIVDLGMHRGEDTDFYLRKGFRVLAVEAVPSLVEEASIRFRDAIAAGDLEILPIAVADYVGEIDFYMSEQDLWGSTSAEMADRGFGVSHQKISVPCTTLDAILADYPTPYFVKIDVEGRDPDCVESLGKVAEKPRFLSFEADLPEPDITVELLSRLTDYGYTRFKLVNQATHSMTRMPNPPLEGRYVDARFTKHSSGPFGEETAGAWLTAEQVADRLLATVKQQAARIEYSARGTVLGIPMARLHRPLMWLYNTDLVTRIRLAHARRKGVEVGGWFDVHAAL